MGRSVSYACGATVVAYGHLDYEDEHDDYTYTDQMDYFREEVKRMFPSTWEQDEWLGREDHVLMANYHALFGMSEYCGLVSYWIVPRYDAGCSYRCGDISPALTDRWIAQIEPKFTSAFGALRKLGSMSNGEGVYELCS